MKVRSAIEVAQDTATNTLAGANKERLGLWASQALADVYIRRQSPLRFSQSVM